MPIPMRGLMAAVFLASATLSVPMPTEAQVAFSAPGLFDKLGAGAKPAEGEAPTPPIAVTPEPPAGGDTPAPPGGDTPGGVTPPPPPPDNGGGATPPPPPPEPVLAVYIAVSGATTGPFNAAQLKEKVASGALTGDTYVWMEGMGEWKRASEVSQLREILAAAPAKPETPDFDIMSYLPGTWRSDPEALQITGVDRASIIGTTDYRRDKTYEGFGQVEMVAQGFTQVLNFTLEGTWEVQNASAQGFVLVLKGQATYYLDTGPFVESVSGAFQLRIADRNTLVNDKGTRMVRLF